MSTQSILWRAVSIPVWLLWTASLLAQGSEPAVAQSDPASAVLRCAVDGSSPTLSPKSLCEQLAGALGRSSVVVADARKGGKGEAVQIMRDDVQWTVVLLRGGVVRSWTRISAADARGREVVFFTRALRSLMQSAPKKAEPCVRLDPDNGRSKRSLDLVYPWAELKPCVRRVIDVVDPWWTARPVK